MSYHSHKLNSSHSHIIERTDPVTGDMVQENDKVVFCAVCKSCFLKDSWIYMKEAHCEQEKTLDAIPIAYSNLIVGNKNNELFYAVRSHFTYMTLFLSVFYFAVLYGSTFNYLNRSLMFLASIAFGGMIGFLTTFALKKFTSFGFKPIRVFSDRIEIRKNIFFWKDIKQIKFRRTMESYLDKNGNVVGESEMPLLFLYLQNGRRISIDFPTTDYQQVDGFMRALAKIPHSTEVSFYTEQIQEHETAQSLKGKNLFIEEPILLLRDSRY